MPKRTDIKKILIIGSGPIVIGQACEFDYSGHPGLQGAARRRGTRSSSSTRNPATIMTDPEIGGPDLHRADHPRGGGEDHRQGAARRPAADAGRPDRPQHGGRRRGGRRAREVRRRDDRGLAPPSSTRRRTAQLFREAMERIGLKVPQSGFARSLEEALESPPRSASRSSSAPPSPWAERAAASPTTVRNSTEIAKGGLDASMIHEIMLEQSALGWKEFELEVMRDKADNVVIICSIEKSIRWGSIRASRSPWPPPRP